MLYTDKIKRLSALIAILLLMTVTVGCDREGENIPTSFPTVSSLKTDGWGYFESAQYDNAITSFNEAKNRNASDVDAYNGLGWSYSRNSDYINAESAFKLMVSLSESPDVLADAYAGLAMMHFATPRELATPDRADARDIRDSIAVDYIEKVLDLKSEYSFTHDTQIDATMLKKVVAQIRFNRGEYLNCIKEIEQNVQPDYFQSLIDKGLVVKVENDTSVVMLFSSTAKDGQASLSLTIDVMGNQKAVELVDVISIKNLTKEVNYQIVSFDEGGQRITFRGNPIPQKDELFLTDYYYAPDYGLVLADLLETLQ